MSVGITVMIAARAASDGASADEVASIAREADKRSECIFMLETLEYLEKGGRIGKAKALLGSLLRIKPMLRIDGEVHELGKERSRRRGDIQVAGDREKLLTDRLSWRSYTAPRPMTPWP